MTYIEKQTFDEERALYGSNDVTATACRFDGPLDGESAFKEGGRIECYDCYFNLRYPFWHNNNVIIKFKLYYKKQQKFYMFTLLCKVICKQIKKH